MKEELSRHIVNKFNLRDLVNVLSCELSGSELNTVLLDVFNRRIQRENPSSLLKKYEENKLVKPLKIDVLELKEEELNCYKISANNGFTPIELSPVTQLGACSVVATVDQKKVLTALRNTEVLADSTNAIALYYASLKRKGEIKDEICNYCNISRMIRTQVFSNPNFNPHFSSLCLVSFGKDTGNFSFEKEALYEHVSTLNTICKEVYKLEQVSFEIICKDEKNLLLTDALSQIREKADDIGISIVDTDDGNNNYYYGFRIKLKIVLNGVVHEIGDGGLLYWTQQLLNNKKERMLVSSVGVQLLHLLTR